MSFPLRREAPCRNAAVLGGSAFWGRMVEIRDFFHGHALNAVDAKGRVSVPASFRNVIDRRARRAAQAGEPLDEKILMIGRHREGGRLQAFDATYSQTLFRQVEERVAHLSGEEKIAALDAAQAEAFGNTTEVSFDGAGRMVLPPLLRRRGGIEGLALFWGAGQTFQIWNPQRFRERFADDAAQLEILEDLLAERGGA